VGATDTALGFTLKTHCVGIHSQNAFTISRETNTHRNTCTHLRRRMHIQVAGPMHFRVLGIVRTVCMILSNPTHLDWIYIYRCAPRYDPAKTTRKASVHHDASQPRYFTLGSPLKPRSPSVGMSACRQKDHAEKVREVVDKARRLPLSA
jgi:hypothetical protein